MTWEWTTGERRLPRATPLHVATPGARKDADPGRRLESRRSTPPLHVATPGARKDADPSRRLESRRSTPPLHVATPGARKDANPGRRLESRRSTPPLHVAILGARKDAGPSRRLESRRSTPPLHVATPGARKDANPGRRLESRRSTPPLHVATPGARKDADPSRRLESRRSTSPLHPSSDGDGDEYCNLRDRVLGAYGGMHLEPHSGTTPTTDVTAACLHTLADVYHHVLLRGDSGLKILLHLDYEDSRARIRSRRGERTGRLTVLPRTRENVLIRIPRWTPLSSVRLKVGGAPLDPNIYGDFVLVAGNLMPAEITLEYGLPVTREVERTTGVDYHLLWRGDEVIGITPNSRFYPFYPDYPEETEGCAMPAARDCIASRC